MQRNDNDEAVQIHPEKHEDYEHGKLKIKDGYSYISAAKHLRTLFFGGYTADKLGRNAALYSAATLEAVCSVLAFVLLVNELANFIFEINCNKEKRKSLDGPHSVTRQTSYLTFRGCTIAMGILSAYFLINGAVSEAEPANNMASNSTFSNTTGSAAVVEMLSIQALIGILLMAIEGFFSDRLNGKKQETIGKPVSAADEGGSYEKSLKPKGRL